MGSNCSADIGRHLVPSSLLKSFFRSQSHVLVGRNFSSAFSDVAQNLASRVSFASFVNALRVLVGFLIPSYVLTSRSTLEGRVSSVLVVIFIPS